jgi:uncharacterized membrane protein YphA (DoxX/SURF4 family)
MNIETIPPILLTAMFFLSGFNKINKFTKTVENLQSKINLNINENIYKLIIALVVILEILAPVIIVYYYITGKDLVRQGTIYAIYGLIIFTILASILYHPLYVNDYFKSIPFWANMSLIGGLLLLLRDVKG